MLGRMRSRRGQEVKSNMPPKHGGIYLHDGFPLSSIQFLFHFTEIFISLVFWPLTFDDHPAAVSSWRSFWPILQSLLTCRIRFVTELQNYVDKQVTNSYQLSRHAALLRMHCDIQLRCKSFITSRQKVKRTKKTSVERSLVQIDSWSVTRTESRNWCQRKRIQITFKLVLGHREWARTWFLDNGTQWHSFNCLFLKIVTRGYKTTNSLNIPRYDAGITTVAVHRTCDLQVAGSSPGWALLCGGLRQARSLLNTRVLCHQAV